MNTSQVRVLIYSKLELHSEALALLLRSKSVVKIDGISSSSEDLLEMVAAKSPQVVVLCISVEDSGFEEVIPQIKEHCGDSKVLVVTPGELGFDHMAALKSGAAGLISPDKPVETLTRAIKQVADGDLWINQQLVTQLLNPSQEQSSDSEKRGKQLLTDREIQVTKAIACGMNNGEISKHLFISEATVRHHLSSIYSKLYVEDRLGLVIYAYQHGVLPGKESTELNGNGNGHGNGNGNGKSSSTDN